MTFGAGHVDAVTLLLLLSLSVYGDVTRGKIPNAMIAAGLSCALAGQVIGRGWRGLWLFTAGAVLPVLAAGWLYYLRMLGAGDIKLLCMAGSFLGPAGSIETILFSILFGGAISAALLVKRGNFSSRFHYFIEYMKETGSKGKRLPYLDGVDSDGRFCFSLPILLSVLSVLLL